MHLRMHLQALLQLHLSPLRQPHPKMYQLRIRLRQAQQQEPSQVHDQVDRVQATIHLLPRHVHHALETIHLLQVALVRVQVVA